MNYEEMLTDLGQRWDQTPESLENIMNRVAYHESAGTMNPEVQQYSGGPGRGLFQFEVGEGAGGATAGNRLMKYLGGGAPDWLTSMVGPSGRIEDLDASQLTPEQQKMLFLGNYRQHPEASLKGVDDSNIGDFWGKYHWAGDSEGSDLYNKKLSSFGTSQTAYNVENAPTADEEAFTGY
jgi:hypothetical protein